MTDKEFIRYMAPKAQADMKKNGILASVTIAQAALESGYLTTDLAVNANNIFGMKCDLSGNTWSGSTWDGVSKYTKQTQEQDEAGNTSVVYADFRKYNTVDDSVGDHSAYLLGAKNGTKKRYAGLESEMDPQTAITIIKNGGYATDTQYVSKVMAVIEKYSLTQYDTIEGDGTTSINIVKKTGTTNTTASAGRTIKYIVIHYTAGVSSASGKAAATAEWFANASAKASADFIVDDATIVQYNPDPKNRYCWAVGGSKQNTKGGSLYGTAKNANCINVEICSTNSTGTVKDANDSSWSFADAALNNAVELVKYLMDLYGIDADHVIRHYDVTGKLCVGIVGWNADSGDESKWAAFKTRIGDSTSSTSSSTSNTSNTTSSSASDSYYRVRKTWADASSQLGAFLDLDKAKACADANSGYYVFDPDGNSIYPFTPYVVKITIDNLNIRKAPNGEKIGKFTGKGTFTIVDESDGWGLLKAYEKNRDGWISLSYATKA